MKFDTCSADDVVEIWESVMDGGERTEIVFSIDTGDAQVETRMTLEQASKLATHLRELYFRLFMRAAP